MNEEIAKKLLAKIDWIMDVYFFHKKNCIKWVGV